jgi:methylated-DNA-[protein]-cysteine S-methyltransferase
MPARRSMHFYHQWKSPLGSLHIICSESHLKVLAFDDNWHILRKKYEKSLTTKLIPLHSKLIEELKEYISQQRKEFTVPLMPEGTDFQKSVWEALLKIPYGQVRSYQAQAASIQNPKAVRAVGSANGKNPISILIPCHRVIGKDGKLRGYAGGLGSKDSLLKIENYN